MTQFRALVALTVLALSVPVGAGEVDPLLRDGKNWLVAQQRSQATVDKIEAERQKMFDEYRTLLREIEGLEAYNRQLTRQIEKQNQEVAELDESIANATTVDRQILPLMSRMVGALEQFIELDVPFLEKERSDRLEFVTTAMDRVDVSVAEKFRQVLEAYNIELEFGRTIEAYSDIQNVEGEDLKVNMLRVGRIGLFYQTVDGQHSGRWNAKTKSWEKVPARYRNAIRDAIKIAKKQKAPNLLTLPLATPEGA